MNKIKFEYSTYISVKPEKLWKAFFEPKLTKKYWQHENVSDWKQNSKWIHRGIGKDGIIELVGKVMEFNPPRRLVLTWANPENEKIDEKHSLVSIDIEPYHGVAKLKVTHDNLEPGSEMVRGITEGWPMVLSSLKSLMETGKALPKLWE